DIWLGGRGEARPCPVPEHPTGERRGAYDRLPEWQECLAEPPCLAPRTSADGAALTGGRLLREHDGHGGGPRATVHPGTGGVDASSGEVRLGLTTSAPTGPRPRGCPRGGYCTEPVPSGSLSDLSASG